MGVSASMPDQGRAGESRNDKIRQALDSACGVIEIPTYFAFCTDGCGGIITEGWSSRPFSDKSDAERALRDHRKNRHG